MKSAINDTILIGDQVTLRYHTKIGRGEQFVFPAPPTEIVDGVELIAAPVTDTLSVEANDINLESRLVITSFDSGSYRLPHFVAYKIREDGKTDTLYFDGGTLEVNTIQIDTTSFRPFDVKGQMSYPFTFKEALPWAALLLLLALIVLLIAKGIKNLKEKRSLFGKPIVTDPPHIVALKGLEKLREDKIWKRDQKEHFTVVTDLLREYIEHVCHFNAMEMTSKEILTMLTESTIEEEIFSELSQLFEIADLVKFAKFRALENECEESVPIAVKFVNYLYIRQIENREESQNNGGE